MSVGLPELQNIITAGDMEKKTSFLVKYRLLFIQKYTPLNPRVWVTVKNSPERVQVGALAEIQHTVNVS